jgi:hypothetical protein
MTIIIKDGERRVGPVGGKGRLYGREEKGKGDDEVTECENAGAGERGHRSEDMAIDKDVGAGPRIRNENARGNDRRGTER